jgi:hypothetical protein
MPALKRPARLACPSLGVTTSCNAGDLMQLDVEMRRTANLSTIIFYSDTCTPKPSHLGYAKHE